MLEGCVLKLALSTFRSTLVPNPSLARTAVSGENSRLNPLAFFGVTMRLAIVAEGESNPGVGIPQETVTIPFT